MSRVSWGIPGSVPTVEELSGTGKHVETEDVKKNERCASRKEVEMIYDFVKGESYEEM